MPPKKKQTPLAVETKEYQVFDPENVKETVEVAVKPRLSIDELTKIEKKGKVVKKRAKKTTKKKSKKTSNSKNSKESMEMKPINLKKDGYVLIVTEKPQAAEKIAAALSDGRDRKISKPGGVSYYEFERNGKPVVVACAVGHLFTVSQNKKGASYPIFDISWFPNFEVKKKDFTQKYYHVIKSLVKGASEIVVATDFDIEGEVIGYNIVRFIAGQKDAKRMKFSSLTAGDIQNSYDNAHPTIEWGQAIAGETRHFLDWLYGINLSRALMSAIKTTGKFKIMSIGRVQGPALNLIVEKELQIKAFKPTPYWQIFLIVNDGKNKLEVKYNKDITKKKDLDKFNGLEGKKAIATTKKTKQTITPPAPFDLTSLQTEAYKFHNITPSQTLQVAQRLYLAGLISYPRTSSQKIPEAMKPLEILKKLERSFSDLTKHTTQKKPIEGNKSDPAHPAIIPTGNTQKLEDQDEKLYNLIVKRFISCFCDSAELENKKVEVEVDSEISLEISDPKTSKESKQEVLGVLRFSAKGMEVLKQGWMNVYPAKMEEKEIKDMNGEVIIEKVKIEEKETKPPKRYSPASILTELEKRNLGTKCLTGDTRVIFNGKLTKVEDLFKEGMKDSKKKDLEIRRINGRTISFDNKNNATFSNSNFISRRRIQKDEKIIKISTDFSDIKLTGDHKIYVYRNKKIKQLPTKDLQFNDKLIGITRRYKEGRDIIKKDIFNERYKITNNEIKHKFASKNHKGILISKFPIKWSTSLAWLLGYFYGDGSYDGPEYNGSHSVSFSTAENKALGLLNENIKNIFGLKPYAYNLGTKYKIDCNSVMSYVLFKTFPELKGKKPIKLPKMFIGDFLRGFFDADGNVHLRPKGRTKIKGIKTNSFDTPRVKFTLGNEILIKWVSELLKELGIDNKINKGVAKCNGKSFDCWTILISGRDRIEKYAYLVGFDSYKDKILYRGLKCNSQKYAVLKNSAKIVLSLLRKNMKIEELIKELCLSRYQIIVALRRLYKMDIINKKRYTNRNKWIYSLINKDDNFIIHCIKLSMNKINDTIYEIPIRQLSKINYKGYVYDLSIDKDSPNFITEGFILVHNSTRANILETLYTRNYIKDRSIKATELGMRLIESLKKHSPIIIDEKLTREIEKDMDIIRSSKKDLELKEKKVIEKAEGALTKISNDFRRQELEIGKELIAANEALFEAEKESNKLGRACPSCKKGELTIKYTPRFRSYFVACTEYPNCKQTFSLPKGMIKNEAKKECEECGWPMLLRIMQGKRPWVFCFNPNCPSRLEMDANGNNKKPEPRYVGQRTSVDRKKIEDVEKVEKVEE